MSRPTQVGIRPDRYSIRATQAIIQLGGDTHYTRDQAWVEIPEGSSLTLSYLRWRLSHIKVDLDAPFWEEEPPLTPDELSRLDG